jgi:hypothetical protein
MNSSSPDKRSDIRDNRSRRDAAPDIASLIRATTAIDAEDLAEQSHRRKRNDSNVLPFARDKPVVDRLLIRHAPLTVDF